jgi:hypothetical protein
MRCVSLSKCMVNPKTAGAGFGAVLVVSTAGAAGVTGAAVFAALALDKTADLLGDDGSDAAVVEVGNVSDVSVTAIFGLLGLAGRDPSNTCKMHARKTPQLARGYWQVACQLEVSAAKIAVRTRQPLPSPPFCRCR